MLCDLLAPSAALQVYRGPSGTLTLVVQTSMSSRPSKSRPESDIDEESFLGAIIKRRKKSAPAPDPVEGLGPTSANHKISSLVSGRALARRSTSEFRFIAYRFHDRSRSHSTGQTDVGLGAHSALQAQPHATDVRFVFPRPDGKVLELWAHSSVLKEVSPYFKQLLEAGFAESTMLTKEERNSSGQDDATFGLPNTNGDADENADNAIAEAVAQGTATSSDTSLAYHQIVIIDACYTTYRALLVWINTGFIELGPRKMELTTNKDRDEDSGLPQPSSAMSMFRLAHLVEIPEMLKLAVEHIIDSLTPSTAADLLFSDLVLCHDTIKKPVLRYCADHWVAVKQSSRFKEVVTRESKEEAEGSLCNLTLELLGLLGDAPPPPKPSKDKETKKRGRASSAWDV